MGEFMTHFLKTLSIWLEISRKPLRRVLSLPRFLLKLPALFQCAAHLKLNYEFQELTVCVINTPIVIAKGFLFYRPERLIGSSEKRIVILTMKWLRCFKILT